VFSGGQLLIAPGSLSRIDDYNEQLYREGAGIMPAKLQEPTAADGSESTSILGIETEHPIFQFLRGRFEIPSATIERYFPASPRQVDANVLARYLSNDPFLIEGQSGHGRVLLMTTALDADWSTLPLSNFYLPFVQSAVRYLAGGAVPKGNLAPGSEIKMTFDDPISNRTAVITRPDGRSVKLDLRLDKQAAIHYSDTDMPGQYRLQIEEPGRAPQTEYFVVRSPREESDLTQLSEERWNWLEKAIGFTRVDPMARPVLDTLSAGREGRELWGVALMAVVALGILELWVARIGTVQRRDKSRSTELALRVEDFS
jgi:hypothetical protein